MESENDVIALSNLRPTLRQQRLTLAVIVFLVATYATIIPFVNVQLPNLRGLLEIILTLLFAANLFTAILIFAQCSISRSAGVLVLANGYLFSSLIMIPYVLTFPGVFSTRPVIGAGIQGSPFVYMWWHFTFVSSVISYTLFKNVPLRSIRPTIALSVLVTAGLVCASGWVIAVYDAYIPRFLLDDHTLTPFAHYAAGLELSIGLVALILLWVRRSSMLDQWLTVAILAIVLELSLVTFFIISRNGLGAYSARLYLAVAATVLLAGLFLENTRLYTRLARSIVIRHREREARLIAINAMSGSIAHEISQPLGAMMANSDAALLWLAKTPPHLNKVRACIEQVANDGRRASEVVASIRALFQQDTSENQILNVNSLILEALAVERTELRDHNVSVETELDETISQVFGSRRQLLQVILNLITNAVEALDHVTDRAHVLRLKTENCVSGDVRITIKDSGTGIDSKNVDLIFEPFFTTKPSGMGLGLWICRAIIENHHGQLTASSGIAHGSAFQIVLPGRKAGAI